VLLARNGAARAAFLATQLGAFGAGHLAVGLGGALGRGVTVTNPMQTPVAIHTTVDGYLFLMLTGPNAALMVSGQRTCCFHSMSPELMKKAITANRLMNPPMAAYACQ
jgi:hypothetical protein